MPRSERWSLMNAKAIARECLAGLLVVSSPFVPSVVFEKYLGWTGWYPEAVAAELACMTLTSLLIAVALLYFAWRIQALLRDDR